MLAHLWTNAPAPQDYADLMLCRMYSCTPDELDRQDYDRVMRHLICINAESKVRNRA